MRNRLLTLTTWSASLAMVVGVSSANAGLVLHSTLDNADIAGTTVKDLALPAQDGEMRDDGTVTAGAVGQIGEAINAQTTGTAAAVDYGDVLDVGSGVQTISLWFNGTNVTTKDQYLVRKGNASSGDVGWSIFLDDRLPQTGQSQYQVTFRANAVGGFTTEARGIGLILLSPEDSVDTWNHLAFVLDTVNGTVDGYVNGSNAGLGTNPWGLNFTPGNMDSSASLLLGVGVGGGTSTLIDDFAIFDEALSASDIQAIYDNGLAGIAVPEPASASLGLMGLALLAKRRRR